jgi:hypothetical protein
MVPDDEFINLLRMTGYGSYSIVSWTVPDDGSVNLLWTTGDRLCPIVSCPVTKIWIGLFEIIHRFVIVSWIFILSLQLSLMNPIEFNDWKRL